MTAPADRRPNLLLITTDQQRFDTIAAAGARHMLTPNLDYLLESGVHFSRCYTDSPVCAPARSTLLTGRHHHNNPPGIGHFNQPSTERPDLTLPAVLTRAGYQTASVGKLHAHPPRATYGYEFTEILEDYYRYMARHPHLGRPMAHGLGQNQMQPALATVDEAHSLTRWTVDRAIDFLETRDPTRPFFLHVGFSKPHPPFDPPLSYLLLYQNRPLPEPIYGDWSADVERIHPGLLGPTWFLSGVDAFTPELIRLARQAYFALITHIDYTLGALLARLRELELLDTTHILFTSDHGEMLGDHHMGAKTTFLEPSAHVPMIYRPARGYGGDALRPGSRCDALVCLADVYRTFTSAAGVAPPAEAAPDSLDLAAVAAGVARRDLLFGRCSNFHMALTPRHKYIFHDTGAELLFDLEADPLERRNLTDSPDHGGVLETLRRSLAELMLRTNYARAVKDGRPAGCIPVPDRRGVRAVSWPGHHSPDHTPHDVLH
ncbi:MAG: sulfatase-like hydrolase/transferase [Tepidisphaerales bacterium]